MKGSTRCLDGRLMRSDPQPDDPALETDRGVCPDCDGAGCEAPKARWVTRQANPDETVLVSFTKRLTDEELKDFEEYCKEWAR